MTERGFVRLYRKLLDGSLIQDHWLFSLWCWCLLKASHREWRGLQPGQFRTGRSTGSEELGVSPSKFYRGLQKLAEQHYIALEVNSSWTTVTICNWKAYQGDTKPERTAGEQQMNSKWTADEHITNTETQNHKSTINTPPTPQGATGLERPPIADASQDEPPGEPLDPTGRTDWRQPNRPGPSTVPEMVPIPDALDTPEFRHAWSLWLASYREHHGRYPPQTSLQMTLVDLAMAGVKDATERTLYTAKKGYKGIVDRVPPEAKQPARTPFMGLTEDDLRDFR